MQMRATPTPCFGKQHHLVDDQLSHIQDRYRDGGTDDPEDGIGNHDPRTRLPDQCKKPREIAKGLPAFFQGGNAVPAIGLVTAWAACITRIAPAGTAPAGTAACPIARAVISARTACPAVAR